MQNKKYFRRKNILKTEKGFTLIEVLISVTLFVVVITIISNLYLSAIGSQRKAFERQNVLDNSRFVLESMGRAIRQSSITSATISRLVIQHPTKGAITYEAVAGRLLETGSPVVANNVLVETLNFIVSGEAGSDGKQPRVTIVLVIVSQDPQFANKTRLRVKTTITPRGIQDEPL